MYPTSQKYRQGALLFAWEGPLPEHLSLKELLTEMRSVDIMAQMELKEIKELGKQPIAPITLSELEPGAELPLVLLAPAKCNVIVFDKRTAESRTVDHVYILTDTWLDASQVAEIRNGGDRASGVQVDWEGTLTVAKDGVHIKGSGKEEVCKGVVYLFEPSDREWNHASAAWRPKPQVGVPKAALRAANVKKLNRAAKRLTPKVKARMEGLGPEFTSRMKMAMAGAEVMFRMQGGCASVIRSITSEDGEFFTPMPDDVHSNDEIVQFLSEVLDTKPGTISVDFSYTSTPEGGGSIDGSERLYCVLMTFEALYVMSAPITGPRSLGPWELKISLKEAP
jgi:hypothetical protein